MISLFSMKPNALLKDEINNDVHFLFAKTKDIYIYQIFFKENIRNPVWICRDPISLILGTRFSLILGTR